MLRRMARLRREQKGSVAILVAFSLTAVLALAALGTDVGRLFVERQRLQVVVDAAALSGAQKLPHDPAGAYLAAWRYLQRNNADLDEAEVTVSSDGHHLDVNLEKAVPMTFARVVGLNQEEVAAAAKARTANLSGYLGAAPLGVPRADWKVGDRVYLKLDSQSGTIAPGNYQALALGKTGSSAYENNLMYGYNSWIRVDDWVDTETGNMAGPTVRAINYRINQDPYSTYTNATRQSARLVVVPILEDFNVNGRGQVHVIGFGVFFLESAVDEGGGKAQVVGRFVRLVIEGEGSLTAPDFGAYTTKLIQ